MELYRYMSTCEFNKYVSGEIMQHEDIHSIGFPKKYPFHFLAQETSFIDTNGNSHNFSPTECYSFLMGIVSSKLLVCIDFPEETYKKRENVQYNDPYGIDDETMTITEYTVDTYNINDNKIIKFAIVNEFCYSNGNSGFNFIWVSGEEMKFLSTSPFKYGKWTN